MQSSDKKTKLLQAGVEIFHEKKGPAKVEFLRLLRQKTPGHWDDEYEEAHKKVETLFKHACKLAFRWGDENPPGATFEIPDKHRVLIDELAQGAEGFTEVEYNLALEYGFSTTIF